MTHEVGDMRQKSLKRQKTLGRRYESGHIRQKTGDRKRET